MNNDPSEKYRTIITREWFETYGTTDPVIAYEKWCIFLQTPSKRKLTEDSYYRKILQVATGTTEASPRHYLHPNNSYKPSEKLSKVFDRITVALGKTLPEHRKGKKYPVYKDQKHIALITELTGLPSLYYHMKLISGLSAKADKHRLNLTIHDISGKNLQDVIDSIIHAFSPSGLIMIRLAPNAASLKVLAEADIPTVLINADHRKYPPPVIGNVLLSPNKKTETDFRIWIRGIPEIEGLDRSKAVLAIMPPRDSHRLNLLTFLQSALKAEGMVAEVFYVKDYEAHSAFDLWKSHPDASAFICMSDRLAVGLKQLFSATGQSVLHRIIGFDDSALAREEGIGSFGQNLDEISTVVTDSLLNALRTNNRVFAPISMNLYLNIY